MSGGDAMPDITLIGIAEGSFPASDAESMASYRALAERVGLTVREG